MFKEKFNEAREIVKAQVEDDDDDDNKEEKENTPENVEEEVTKKLSELEVTKDEV